MPNSLVALLLAAAATPAPMMPPAFQGDWYEADGEIPTCSGNAGGGHFQIRPKELEDPISVYKITAVRRLSPTSVHVRFIMRSEEQNISQPGSARLTLRDNGTRLQAIGEGQLASEYITDEFRRCRK